MRLPRSIGEAAVAAWEREESEETGVESREQWALRDDAAELALIGAAISSRGVWEDDEIVVDLDIGRVAAALRAAE